MLHATDLIPSKTAMDDNIGNNTRYFFHWGTYTAKDSMNILPEGNTHVKLSRFFIFSIFYSSTIYFLINFMWNCFMHKSVIRLIIYFCGSCVIFYAKKKKIIIIIISERIKIIFYVSFLYAWHIFN